MSRTSCGRTFWRTALKNGAWRVRSLKALYLLVVSDFLTAPMPWLFSKNTFAHEDPATINAVMSASVELTRRQIPHHRSSTVFTHRHLDLLLTVPLRNCPPTHRASSSWQPPIRQVRSCQVDTPRCEYLPTISTNHSSCSSLPFPIAGATNDDSSCSIARRTHSPPLEPLRVVHPKRAVT